MRITYTRSALAAVLLTLPSALGGYGVAVHDLFPREALGAHPSLGALPVSRELLPGASDADVERFRLWLHQRASALPDTALRHRFRARYPGSASFDARAMREFFMMNGARRVLGVDSFGAVRATMSETESGLDPHLPYLPGRPIALVEALQLGSIYPDLDRRNQARLARDARGAPLRTARGDSIPFDPMALNMGALTGLTSQAHAHYGLNRAPKSADPATLKARPWDFALATGFDGPVETYAPDNAQLYTDLSLLAELSGTGGGRTLAALYAGNAMHYVADVGNAVHTVQVGSYAILVDATLQHWLRHALTLFGLLGDAPSRDQIGLDIITNLHTLSERLYQEQLLEAVGRRHARRGTAATGALSGSLTALEHGDDSLARVLANTLSWMGALEPVPAFGRAVAEIVVDANMRDGGEVYRLTRAIAASRLRAGRVVVDFDTVPELRVWSYVRVRRGAVVHTKLDDFNAVHQRGIARTTTALRAWWDAWRRIAGTPAQERAALTDAVLARLVTERLAYLDAAERRREAWIAQHGGLAGR